MQCIMASRFNGNTTGYISTLVLFQPEKSETYLYTLNQMLCSKCWMQNSLFIILIVEKNISFLSKNNKILMVHKTVINHVSLTA